MTYIKGTQEQLDAAREDATLIPFNTLFQTKDGELVFRGCYMDGEALIDHMGDNLSVAMSLEDKSDYDYFSSNQLEVVK